MIVIWKVNSALDDTKNNDMKGANTMATKTNPKEANVSKTDAAKTNQTAINALLKQLAAAKHRHEKCRLRNQLRRLGHWGGLRNRTYLNKATDKTVVVEKKAKKTA